MDQLTWLALGAAAMLVTGATARASVDEIVGGLAGTFLWALWGLGSLSVEIYSGGELVATRGYPQLAFLAVAGAGICLLLAFTGVEWVLGAARPRQDGIDTEKINE
jgi:hypothetical protein